MDAAPRQLNASLGALAWMALSLASFTVIAIAGREAAHGATTTEIMLFRAILSLIGVAVWGALAIGTTALVKTERLGLHAVRAATHFGAQFCWLHALPLIPLAQLFALEFTAPLWVALLAPLLLGERLTALRLAAAGLGFAGALIVVRPGQLSLGFGEALGLASALGFALSMLATKRLLTTEPPLRILFHMFLLQTLIALVLVGGRIRLPDALTFGWIALLSLLGIAAHYALARAFALADAIIVAPMDFLRLPLIALVGVAVYREALDPVVLFGGAIVLAANFLNLWAEQRTKRATPTPPAA